VITLSAVGYKVRGVQTVDLTWRGAISANIDIYRDGVIRTVPNTGSYTDSIGVKGGNDSYRYKVCESLTENCSNEVTVRFGGRRQ
jgi:serine protease